MWCKLLSNLLSFFIWKAGENIKITDFNVSKFCEDYKVNICKHISMITYTGTIAFSAPELLSHNEYKFILNIFGEII